MLRFTRLKARGAQKLIDAMLSGGRTCLRYEGLVERNDLEGEVFGFQLILRYTSSVPCHVVLPYEWVECVDLEKCQRIVHDEKSAEVMNGYPQEWVQSMLGFSVEKGEQSDTELIAFRNSEGAFHREGGPAIEWAGGHHVWYENGELHREGGPAAVYADGFEMWYIRGQNVGRGGMLAMGLLSN